MAASDDPAGPPAAGDDLSALSWVQDELRRSLELAHKALRRYLKEQEQLSDLDTIDPAVLRQARSQLHQSVGVLELVGLGRAAELLRAAEAALQRLSARPKLITPAAVATIERGSFALLDFIARRLAGKAVSTLSLFPQYKALQELAGAARIQPADLWTLDWSWRDLALDASVAPRRPDEATVSRIEADLLALMRGAPPSVAGRMSELFAALAAAAQALALAGAAASTQAGTASPSNTPHARLATLWQLAAGFFEAQADGLLQPDAYNKRIGSKLLAQLRAGEQAEPSDRLAHDLLFFCSQAAPRASAAVGPRLAAVRRGYQLGGTPAVDYDQARLGRFDPAWVAQARKRVLGAKEVWSAVAGGDLARLSGLSEQFALVADSLARLYPDGGVLGRSLQVAAAHTTATGAEPPAELAMEVATALLYLDASIDDGDFDHADGAQRIQRLAQRIDQVRQARDPGTLELWMEELYRRVSDRQTMGSVVQELRASLSEVEKNIDQYFRNPAQREVLIPVPAQLSAMRGVLSVLGLDQASQAVLRMRDDVDALASTEVNPQHAIQVGTFDRLADNLGALSFLIDMVSVQPQMAKSLFRFDAETGSLSAVMAREDRPTGFEDLDTRPADDAPDRPPPAPDTDALEVTLEFDRIVKQARAAQRAAPHDAAAERARAQDPLYGSHGLPMLNLSGGSLAESQFGAIGRFVPGAEAAPPLPLSALAPAPAAAASTPVSSGLEDDPEMREVFLDEAREVLAGARESLAVLQARHDDQPALTTVRRAFHTLKGSARMVGLVPFGIAAWACEQIYNARLAEPGGLADAALREFSLDACGYFEQWVQALADGDASAFSPDRLLRPAELLRDAPSRLTVPGALHGAEPAAAPGRDGEDAAAAQADHAAPLHRAPPLADGLLARVPDLPLASDLDLLPLTADAALPPDAALPDLPALPDALAPAAPAAPEPALPALHLSALDGAGQPASATITTTTTTDADADLALPVLPVAEVTELEFSFDFAVEPAAAETAATDRSAAEPAASAAPAAVAAAEAVDLPPAPLPVAGVGADADPLPLAATGTGGDAYRQIGPLRIGIPLFNIYLYEADELSRRLGVELAEWALEQQRPVGEAAVALAHSLAGSSGTVGYGDLSQLARALEHALGRSQQQGHGRGDEARLFNQAADEIRRLLHLFAAGFLTSPDADLLRALQTIAHSVPDLAPETAAEAAADTAVAAPPADAGPTPAATALAIPAAAVLGRAELRPFEALPQAPPPQALRADGGGAGFDEDIDQVDALDDELFGYFVEEALELLPQLHARLRDWARRPAEPGPAAACMRSLHTFKGSARLAGAMRLGEIAHRLESEVERLSAAGPLPSLAAIEALAAHADVLDAGFDALRQPAGADGRPAAPPAAPLPAVAVVAPVVAAPVAAVPVAPAAPPAVIVKPTAPATPPAAADAAAVAGALSAAAGAPATAPAIDWQRFAALPGAAEPLPAAGSGAASAGSVRVRAPLLDRLVNRAGEVSITRARIQSDVGQIKGSLDDLTDNLERLRAQLRDIELQAETQIGTRMEAARAAAAQFDPLEMDRFTRFQELTRMMAESVADVATVQRSLQRTLQSTEDTLAHQARMTRDMQDDLLRTRMVEFEGMSERLYRVVRQAAKETAKSVRLDIVGGSIEIDRGVLDRMTPAFEHLLRNSVVHGIEAAGVRAAAGKPAIGSITLAVSQIGNEVGVEVRDDGAGLNLAAIRERALAMGLLSDSAQPDEAELANLIFQPGVTTAASISDLAGRGVGMDVVRTDVNAMGGRIETASAPGQGSSFRLVLPLTTAVTQVVMLRCGTHVLAVPATLVEIVRRVALDDLAAAYAQGVFSHGGAALPFFWLDALLLGTARGLASGRTAPVVVIRSAAQRVVLHVDEVLGHQEVVVKNLGPQLSRVPGLVGMTLLPSGLPALIYNPVALATLYGDAAHAATRAALQQAALAGGTGAADATVAQAPLVLVVDDSLTVRRITQRLLEREGYRVQVAKDGLDGLERLAAELPMLLVTDIEMPRMDGFDLVRNLRADARSAGLPVIMITSRIAQKHRNYAAELGVDHYLGKPYVEDELLGLVARYARRRADA